jgi:arabinogalactan endo-1,4-beta-galactosidase
MRISGAFPSDYLKAADLDGKPVLLIMSHVEMKDIGGDHKPILFFKGSEKGMVMNKTNANNIAALYGDDTDNWQGKEIVLFEAMVDFQGKTVAAIRVRAPKQRQPISDEVPF